MFYYAYILYVLFVQGYDGLSAVINVQIALLAASYQLLILNPIFCLSGRL